MKPIDTHKEYHNLQYHDDDKQIGEIQPAQREIEEMKVRAEKNLDALSESRKNLLSQIAEVDASMRLWMEFLGKDPRVILRIIEEPPKADSDAPGQDPRR